MLRHLALITLGCLLTIIGLAGGWYAGQHGASVAAPDEAEADAAGADATMEFDKRTLANIGVAVAPAKRSTFVRYRDVQAVIEDRPSNGQPVASPLGGIVIEVKAEAGAAVAAGDALIHLARDPIPLPKPDLTADVLKPLSEEIHEAVAALRVGLGKLKIVDANLLRVTQARAGHGDSEFPILRRSEIQYQNERAGILISLEGARHELERHGLSEEDIRSLEAGGRPPMNASLWAHALKRNGLWPKAADAIRAALPPANREASWVTAAIGELAANGLATEALATALATNEAMATHFAETAGLMLQGTPLETVGLIARVGGLDATTILRAPATVDLWDVEEVLIRPGRRVEPGEVLMRLHDPRIMWLRLEPIGNELGSVVEALGAGTELEAVALLPNSGPDLNRLRLTRMATFSDAHERGGRAYAEVPNTRLCPSGEQVACSWNLRVGLRYVVRVPVGELPGRFVFPVGAVTTRGPDRVVYVQDGETFRAQPVRVEFENDEFVVVADDGGIFEDDPVAISGAFALGLALQADTNTANSHGHAH